MSDLMGATMSRMAVMRMGVRSRLTGTSGERFRITDESAPCTLVQDSQPDSLRNTRDHPCLSACRAVLSACLRGAAVVSAKARRFEPRRRAVDGDARQLCFVLAPKVETAAATVCPPITPEVSRERSPARAFNYRPSAFGFVVHRFRESWRRRLAEGLAWSSCGA